MKERAFFDTETSVETAVFNGIGDPNVDAADFGGKPGEFRLFGREDAGRFQPTFSTHKVPIDLLMGVIASRKKQGHLLGIQPGSRGNDGEGPGGRGNSKIIGESGSCLTKIKHGLRPCLIGW